MPMSKKYLLVPLFVWTLCGLAQSQDSCSVCVLKDAPNQCGAFCLAALHPLYDQMAETREKLDKMKENQERDLKYILDTMERNAQFQTQVLALINAMKDQQIAMQMRMEDQERNLMSIVKKIDINTTSQYKDLQETLIRIYTKVFILKDFERIGSRYFHIQNDIHQDWTTAEESCRQMGAHLASFKNQKEFDAINLKLRHDWWYWVGINDKSKEGNYTSVDTNKTANFLDWHDGEPNNLDSNENCVAILFGKMYDRKCNQVSGFICVSNDSF